MTRDIMDDYEDMELTLTECGQMLDSLFPIEGDAEADTDGLAEDVAEQTTQDEIFVETSEPEIKDYSDEF